MSADAPTPAAEAPAAPPKRSLRKKLLIGSAVLLALVAAELIARGVPFGPQDVASSVRALRDDPESSLTTLLDDAIVVGARRRAVRGQRPRSLGGKPRALRGHEEALR